jgi:hypothetical protein
MDTWPGLPAAVRSDTTLDDEVETASATAIGDALVGALDDLA